MARLKLQPLLQLVCPLASPGCFPPGFLPLRGPQTTLDFSSPEVPSLACQPTGLHPMPCLGMCVGMSPLGTPEGHLCRNSWKEEKRR